MAIHILGSVAGRGVGDRRRWRGRIIDWRNVGWGRCTRIPTLALSCRFGQLPLINPGGKFPKFFLSRKFTTDFQPSPRPRSKHHPHIVRPTLLEFEWDCILASITRRHHLCTFLFLDHPLAGSVDDKLNQRPLPPRILFHLEATPQSKTLKESRCNPVSQCSHNLYRLKVRRIRHCHSPGRWNSSLRRTYTFDPKIHAQSNVLMTTLLKVRSPM